MMLSRAARKNTKRSSPSPSYIGTTQLYTKEGNQNERIGLKPLKEFVTLDDISTTQNNVAAASRVDIDRMAIVPAQKPTSLSMNNDSAQGIHATQGSPNDCGVGHNVGGEITTENMPSYAPMLSSTLVTWQDIVDSRFDASNTRASTSELAGPYSDDTKMPQAETVEDGDNDILSDHWFSDNNYSTYKVNYGEGTDNELKTLLLHDEVQAPVSSRIIGSSSSTGIHTLDNVVSCMISFNDVTDPLHYHTFGPKGFDHVAVAQALRQECLTEWYNASHEGLMSGMISFDDVTDPRHYHTFDPEGSDHAVVAQAKQKECLTKAAQQYAVTSTESVPTTHYFGPTGAVQDSLDCHAQGYGETPKKRPGLINKSSNRPKKKSKTASAKAQSGQPKSSNHTKKERKRTTPKVQSDQAKKISKTAGARRVLHRPFNKEIDVLMGRGGGVNHNPGNIEWRKFIESHKAVYNGIPSGGPKGKGRHGAFAKEKMDEFRNQTGGEFVTKDKLHIVPDEKAIEKTRQALSE